MLFTVQHLTPGERLHLHFRRSGLSVIQLAQVYEVSDKQFKRWMKDQGNVPQVPMDAILPFEACYIINRRAGVSYRTLAQTVGVSKTNVDEFFRGKYTSKRILTYFNNLGWEFE